MNTAHHNVSSIDTVRASLTDGVKVTGGIISHSHNRERLQSFQALNSAWISDHPENYRGVQRDIVCLVRKVRECGSDDLLLLFNTVNSRWIIEIVQLYQRGVSGLKVYLSVAKP